MKKYIRIFASAVMSAVMLFSGTVIADETDPSSVETTESVAQETFEETSGSADVTIETNSEGKAMINGKTFETIYGSQLPTYLDHQYYYDTNPIPKAESNFYFIHIFSLMSQDALNGDYPITSENYIDLAYPLPNGELEQMSYSILGDVFKEWSEAQIQSTYIILGMAHENGMFLTEEDLAQVDEYIDSLEDIAGELGMDLDTYLKLFYGDDCTKDVFRGIMERYQLSTKFSNEYYKICEFSEDEIMAPHVCHALFTEKSKKEKEKDEAEGKETKGPKELAEEFLAVCNSPQDILTNGKKLVDQNICRECADYFVTKNSNYVEAFEKWAVDPERQVGDMEIVLTEYGYHVMGFLGVEEVSDTVKQNLALSDLNDEVGAIAMSGVHSFYTNDKFGTPPEVKGSTAPEETSEPFDPSLPLDDEGNLVIEETTETTRPSEYITSSPIKIGGEVLFGRYTAAVIAGAILLIIIVIVVFVVLKNRKNHTAVIVAEPEDDEEEIEEDGTYGED